MELTSKQKQLRTLLQFWMVAFLGTSVVFFFFGQKFLITVNNLTGRYLPSLAPVSILEHRFWLCLVMSLMLTLVFLAYWAQKDIRQNLGFVLPILVSKFFSTFFYFISFLTLSHAGAYLLGLITDGMVFLITFYFYVRVIKEKK